MSTQRTESHDTLPALPERAAFECWYRSRSDQCEWVRGLHRALKFGAPSMPEADSRYHDDKTQEAWEAWQAATAQQAAEVQRLRADAERLRYALGDAERKLNVSQLTRRAYELFEKAAKWDDWHEAQNRVETEMPEGWAFVIQCSPGDWDTYLTNPDGERVSHRDDCDTLAQQMHSAVDVARAARQDGAGEQAP